MKIRFDLRLLSLVILLISLLLTACGGSDEPTPPPPTLTPIQNSIYPLVPTPTPDSDLPTPTAEPTNTPEPTPDVNELTSFSDDERGYTIQHLSQWIVKDLFETVRFASNEEVLDSFELGEEGAYVDLQAVNVIDLASQDPLQTINTLIESDLGEGISIIEAPSPFTVNGQNGAKAVVTGNFAGQEVGAIALSLALVVNGERGVFLSLNTPIKTRAQYQPVFEAMANSIEIGQPTETEKVFKPEKINASLVVPDSRSTSIAPGEIDVWTFTGKKDQEVLVRAVPFDEKFDVLFNVYNEAGISILPHGEQDISGPNTQELRVITLPADGEYMIAVRGYFGLTGGYEIALSEADVEKKSIKYGDSVESTIATIGAISKLTFTASEGDVIDILATPLDPDFDLALELFDAEGTAYFNQDTSEGQSPEQISKWVVPSNGQYTIIVRGYSSTTGNYVLTLASE